MITVLDEGRPYSFSFDEILKYHGPNAPGGVAFAYKLMELSFPLLSPNAPMRRLELEVETSFGGLGVRDSFEMVTHAITRGCYKVDPAFGDEFSDRGLLRGYLFKLTYNKQTLTFILREGIVRDEFITLAKKGSSRSRDESLHFAWLKKDMAERVMQLHCSCVFELIS